VFFVASGVLIPLAACGTSASNVSVCNEIESARCTRASELPGNCGIDFMAPFADGSYGTPAENAAACIRFYTIACLHGTMTTASLGGSSLTQCLDSINGGTCAVVLDPIEAGGGACNLLIPPEAGPDVAETGADAGTDARSDADSSDLFDSNFLDVLLEADSDGQPGLVLPFADPR
jgi:hypothetical protein